MKQRNAARWLRTVGSLGGTLATVAAITLVVVTEHPDNAVKPANAVVTSTPVKPADAVKPTDTVVNSTDQIVGDGVTIEVSQSDTTVQFVPPLDGNPLTHEWFHTMTAGYKITGPKASTFAGHISIGYLVGYPATFNARVAFDWKTPSLSYTLCATGCGPSVGDLIPQLGVELSVQNGPGVQSVVAAQGEVQGPEGQVHISNLHGTVTGVMGQVRLRPYVTIQAAHGDEVTTYGPTFTN
jgi:hypothetical protein